MSKSGTPVTCHDIVVMQCTTAWHVSNLLDTYAPLSSVISSRAVCSGHAIASGISLKSSSSSSLSLVVVGTQWQLMLVTRGEANARELATMIKLLMLVSASHSVTTLCPQKTSTFLFFK